VALVTMGFTTKPPGPEFLAGSVIPWIVARNSAHPHFFGFFSVPMMDCKNSATPLFFESYGSSFETALKDGFSKFTGDWWPWRRRKDATRAGVWSRCQQQLGPRARANEPGLDHALL